MANPGKLPDFVLIGAMKAGTTTLFAHLASQPSLFMTPGKEPGFFSRDERFARGVDWYRRLFADAEDGQLCGEASTCYTRQLEFPLAASRMAAVVPDAKLVYLLRHPVDRAYSHYVHLMARLWEEPETTLPTFEEALTLEPTILDTSRYDVQLARYRCHFAREKLLLLTLDDLRRDLRAVMGEILAFLRASAGEPAPETALHKNFAGEVVVRRHVRQKLRAYSERPMGRVLRGVLPVGARRWLKKHAERSLGAMPDGRRVLHAFRQALGPLTSDHRARLVRDFSETTRAMEDALGRSLDTWKQ